MRKSGMIEAILPRTRRQILGALLLNADSSYYLSDLANHLGTSPSSLQRELAALADAGILAVRRDGNRTYYQANIDCPIFPDLRQILLKTTGLVDEVREALSDLSPHIRSAFVYGSVAKGEEKSSSDVDVLVIGPVKMSALTLALQPLERKLRRSVNPLLYTAEEFRSKLADGNHFLNSIVDEPKIFIICGERELAAVRD